MISAKICDPLNKHEFMDFVHGTTCIVAVPHGAESELRITLDQCCTLSIETGAEELLLQKIERPGASIPISQLKQPLQRSGVGLADLFKFGPFRKNLDLSLPSQRLYNFRAVIQEGSPPDRGEILATFDFHVLCEVDFHWARAYHLELDGKAKSSGYSVTQRAEGSCLFCQEARARLEKIWRFEA